MSDTAPAMLDDAVGITSFAALPDVVPFTIWPGTQVALEAEFFT